MAKEHFHYPETQSLFQSLETLRQRSGVSRGQAFEDWLSAMICALAAETMEEPYLAMVERYKKGKPGSRGIDLMGHMFGQLVHAMERNDADILGDLFQGCITHGENSLYLTPDSITRLLAELTVPTEERPASQPPQLINDCCCGTGRMLLEAAKLNPTSELVGQDIDSRCARITALNLGLRGLYGWVVCGNTLSGETQFAYRIGHFYHETPHGLRRGVIREVSPAETPVPVIAERTRTNVGALFQEQEQSEPEQAVTAALPNVIEIPRWVARLEKALAAADDDEQGTVEEASPVPTPLPTKPDDPPRQRELF